MMIKLILFTVLGFATSQLLSQSLSPAKVADKWGFVNSEKTWVIKPKFESAKDFSEDVAAAAKKGKWGFINYAGKWVIKPKFTLVGNFSESLAAVQINNLWGFVNKEGELKINPSFEQVLPFKNGEAVVMLPGMLTKQKILINTSGKQISPPYILRNEVSPNVFHIVSQKADKDSVFCYVNGEGELLTDWYLNDFAWGQKGQIVSVFASLENDQEPVPVLENKTQKLLYAFIDEVGQVISPWYEEIQPFRNGIAPAKKKHRYGFITETFEPKIDFKYLEVKQLDETRYVVQTKNEGFLLLNLDGSVISKEYNGFDLFDDEHIIAYSTVDFLEKKTHRKALFTNDCKQVSGWYTEIYPRTNSYHRVLDEEVRYDAKGELYFVEVYNYIVDSTGDVLSTWRPTSSFSWSTEIRRNKDSVLQFLHQPNSKYIIDPTFFEDVYFTELEEFEVGNGFHFKGGDFHDGIAMVSEVKSSNVVSKNAKGITFLGEDVKYGFIDWDGDLIIPCKYDYISGFSDGKAVFRQNDKFGAIDYRGKVVLQPKFDLLGNFGSGMAPFYADSAWGYVYVSGKTALKPIYNEALPHRYGYAAVKIDKKWGLIDAQGNTVLDFKYRKPPVAVSSKKVRILIDGVGYSEIDL